MGFRMRKSINLGGGFRINVSKSGIGYSWGTKGFRITKTARGSTRKTYSIPGTGISYVEENGGKGVSSKDKNANQVVVSDEISTENANTKDYQSVEYKELLEKLTKIQKWNGIGNLLLIAMLVIAFIFPLFAFIVMIGACVRIYTYFKIKVPIEYTFDEESRRNFDKLSQIWMRFNQTDKFWQIISESTLNKKTSGGAVRGLKRIPAKAINKLPFFIKSNIHPFGLKLTGNHVYFLPDKILVVSAMNVGAINYSDVKINFGRSEFVETEKTPRDAHILGYTWLKVNKNGTPDKRYKKNKQVPVCEYGTVSIQSTNGLRIELMCSNIEMVREMQEAIMKLDYVVQ